MKTMFESIYVEFKYITKAKRREEKGALSQFLQMDFLFLNIEPQKNFNASF